MDTLLDELTLLRWIRDHIAAFGGDPKRVTLMGQSSGGAEINALCVSPLAKGLFSQAFVMGLSNYRMPTQPCDWETAAESKARRAFPELSLAQLRDADPSLFLQGQPMQHLTMDGHVLDMSFNEGVDSGRTAGIRMMLGMVRDDAVVTDALTPSPARFPQRTREDFLQTLRESFGPLYGEAAALYDLETENYVPVMMQMNQDYLLASNLAVADTRAQNGDGETFLCFFNHVMPGPMSEMAGVFHSS